MSKVSEALLSIDEALRLGNITDEISTKLRTYQYKNEEEFNELYNVAMSLNNADFNPVALEKFL